MMPVKIRRDKFDGSLLDARALGILASPASASAQVTIVSGEYRKVSEEFFSSFILYSSNLF